MAGEQWVMSAMSRRWSVAVLMAVAMVVVVGWPVGKVDAFTLTILHTNDVHARYTQSDKYGGQCSTSDEARGKCYGGFPRLFTKVEEIRKAHNNTVLVDAGDQYQGTVWFYKYGGNITAHFMNSVRYDVMALGNHEFDREPAGLEVLMEMANFSIVSSNVNASLYPVIHNKLRPSMVLTVAGQKVGFVGYTTSDTSRISSPGKVTFTDEVDAVRSEVERLTSEGVTKIVCVGHGGFHKDLEVARDIPGVDIVVGGHTNTFLYNGEPPSNEDPTGGYPEVVTRADGTRSLVVQDYAFAKYLGFLQVEFDDDGKIKSWSGNPILLNSSIPRDGALMSDLAEWRKGVEELTNETVGETAVLLMGQKATCRLQECNMGNLISDAMVRQNLRHSDGIEWNDVAIALLNSGGIRASISKGLITVADILQTQPFRNSIDIVEVNGSALMQVMQHSGSLWDRQEMNGGFLQHSGLRVTYDVSLPKGERVIQVQVKCTDCDIPKFVDLEPAKLYKVILSTFLVNGGDGYTAITKNILRRHRHNDLDSDVLIEYISKFSPITHGEEGRIKFVDSMAMKCDTSRTSGLLPPCLLWLLASVACAALSRVLQWLQ